MELETSGPRPLAQGNCKVSGPAFVVSPSGGIFRREPAEAGTTNDFAVPLPLARQGWSLGPMSATIVALGESTFRRSVDDARTPTGCVGPRPRIRPCDCRCAGAGLPKPNFQRDPADPAWLTEAVQFHGHLGPWLVAGLRMGMAGRQTAEAQGYFDLEVRVEGPMQRPPDSCFLDGLQIATGATLGKRNLHWTEGKQVIVRVTNVRSGKTIEVRPTEKLLALVTSIKPAADAMPGHRHDGAGSGGPSPEAVAREIAKLPDEKLLTLAIVKVAEASPEERADAEKAKAALLELIRSDPKLFVGSPDVEKIAKLPVRIHEVHRFTWSAFVIDVSKRTYHADLVPKEGSGLNAWFYSGKFEVNAAGHWTAQKPDRVMKAHPLPGSHR